MIPKRIRVGPFTYGVKVAELDGELGTCDHDKLLIAITTNQPPEGERDTVLHEVLHACSHLTGLAARLGDAVEEDVVRSLSSVLLDTLQRNRSLRDYLFD